MLDLTADSMLRDAAMVVGKDLRLEWRSRVTLSQILPFALLVLILFAFALDPDRREVQSRDPPPARGQPHRVASLARADIERATGSQ